MRFDNDYFLEDYIDIFASDRDVIQITYDILFHQPLEKYLTEKTNILINGTALKTRLFTTKRWYLFQKCTIINIVLYANFITYTVKIGKIEDDGSLHVQRKLKIKRLMRLQHMIPETI